MIWVATQNQLNRTPEADDQGASHPKKVPTSKTPEKQKPLGDHGLDQEKDATKAAAAQDSFPAPTWPSCLGKNKSTATG
jgi:hypothetical protein